MSTENEITAQIAVGTYEKYWLEISFMCLHEPRFIERLIKKYLPNAERFYDTNSSWRVTCSIEQLEYLSIKLQQQVRDHMKPFNIDARKINDGCKMTRVIREAS